MKLLTFRRLKISNGREEESAPQARTRKMNSHTQIKTKRFKISSAGGDSGKVTIYSDDILVRIGRAYWD
jgi:hypothetical protein